MTVTNCTMTGIHILGVEDVSYGGGIYNEAGSALTVTGSNLSGFEVISYGGAIQNDGVATIKNCTFANNLAETYGGGAISNFNIFGSDGVASLTVKDCTFLDNSTWNQVLGTSGAPGGAIFSWGQAMVSGSTFSGNTTLDGGGAIEVHLDITIKDCLFAGNTSAIGGGGIQIEPNGTATIANCILTNNSSLSRDGGGILNYGGTVAVNYCLFSGNSAAQNGGAICNRNLVYGTGDGLVTLPSTLSVTGCVFTGNSAGGEGGGVYLDAGSVATIKRSMFFDNTPDNIFGMFVDAGGNSFA